MGVQNCFAKGIFEVGKSGSQSSRMLLATYKARYEKRRDSGVLTSEAI